MSMNCGDTVKQQVTFTEGRGVFLTPNPVVVLGEAGVWPGDGHLAGSRTMGKKDKGKRAAPHLETILLRVKPCRTESGEVLGIYLSYVSKSRKLAYFEDDKQDSTSRERVARFKDRVEIQEMPNLGYQWIGILVWVNGLEYGEPPNAGGVVDGIN
ncbi:hypothetical protein P691DRAFT_788880 [Macrolepiota fuliginosa MF-IS2]|uniref:Uncharacterized protein n=1 Tax=Macrolepiota fuliginosa MF-IS2 TaxID=1400762 RepID=A0A9P5X229_9AGAR|nr:hypothetical protein P691DRAFT_788880 [Macrolepiota fuliginosa MF-IS2]